MALIKCPECGAEVSDGAEKCVYCGYIIRKETGNDEGKENEPRLMWMGITGIVFAVIGYFILPIIFNVAGFVFGMVVCSSNPKKDSVKNSAHTVGTVAVWMNAVGIGFMILNIFAFSLI